MAQIVDGGVSTYTSLPETWPQWINRPGYAAPVSGETVEEKSLRNIHNIYYQNRALTYADLAQAMSFMEAIPETPAPGGHTVRSWIRSRAFIFIQAIQGRVRDRSQVPKPITVQIGNPNLQVVTPTDPAAEQPLYDWSELLSLDPIANLFSPGVGGGGPSLYAMIGLSALVIFVLVLISKR